MSLGYRAACDLNWRASHSGNRSRAVCSLGKPWLAHLWSVDDLLEYGWVLNAGRYLDTPVNPNGRSKRTTHVGQSFAGVVIDTSRAPLVFLRESLCSISQWTHRNMNRPLAMCQTSERTGLVCFRRSYGQSTPAPVSQHVLQPDYILRKA